MHKYGRTDGNHKLIVAALRQAGASVQSLADIGNGCFDLLVGRLGVNYLIEEKVPGAKLTPMEQKFFSEWRGQKGIAYSPEDALRIVGAI